MNINIDILIENNTVSFNYILPIEYAEKDEEFYIESSYKPFYIEKGIKINLENLMNKTREKYTEVLNHFNIETPKKINLHFNLLSTNSKEILEFAKINNNIKIYATLTNTEYEVLAHNLKNENVNNLYITFENCNGYISYKDFYDMFKELDKIVKFVKKYNLSEIEQIMLVYDIIKANEYNKEDNTESYNDSRNLDKVIKGNKIVCVGYSNLINYILTCLGIKNRITLMNYSNKKEKHVRNLILINDNKYDIKGLFLLDCTWDSKKNDNYLNNYNFFLKSLNFFKQAKTEKFINPSWLELLKLDDEDMINKIKNINEIDKKRYIYSMSSISDKNISNLYLIAINGNDLTNELINSALYIKKLINRKIPKDVFKNSLYKIRKIEYINEIINEDITEEKIDNICNKFYRESDDILLLKILGLYKEPTLEKDLIEAKASNVKEDVLRIKLLKILKEYLGDIPQDNFIKKM